MPLTIQGNIPRPMAGTPHFNADLGYRYPNDWNLMPNSDFHKFLVNKILDRVQSSYDAMAKYKESWRQIDQTLRVFMPPESIQNKNKKKNPTYSNLVIPESYATKETILTYYMASFLQDPVFQYDGVGPEDVIGAELLTHLIKWQFSRMQMAVNLHTMFNDDTVYGFGVMAPTWRRYYGDRPFMRQFGHEENGIFVITDEKPNIEKNALMYEGNELMNINPYLYLPDVSVPIHRPDKAEYVAWIEQTTYTNLAKIEQDPKSELFNVRYLYDFDCRSQYAMMGDKQHTRDTWLTGTQTNRSADVIWMYIDLIPRDWHLGDSEYPEKWLFALAGDQVIIQMTRVNYGHQRHPVVVCASNFDGYSAMPVSKLAMVQDIQTIINFMYISYIQNVRKGLNDMYVVDPSIINYYDLLNPEPGKIIRTRRAAWGTNLIDNAFKQLNVQNYTQENIPNAEHLSSVLRRISATSDAMQGSLAPRTTRVSSREAGGMIGAALNRYKKSAQMIDAQAMNPLSMMLAEHTKQYMSKETYIKVSGSLPKQLLSEYAMDGDRVPVSPYDIMIDYDIVSSNRQVPGSEDPQIWSQLFQIASSNPVIAQRLDWIRLFKHLARNMGAENVDNFIVTVQPNEQILQAQQAGNIVPMNQQMTQGAA